MIVFNKTDNFNERRLPLTVNEYAPVAVGGTLARLVKKSNQACLRRSWLRRDRASRPAPARIEVAGFADGGQAISDRGHCPTHRVGIGEDERVGVVKDVVTVLVSIQFRSGQGDAVGQGGEETERGVDDVGIAVAGRQQAIVPNHAVPEEILPVAVGS